MAVPRAAPSALLALLVSFLLVSASSSPASELAPSCPRGKVPCPGTSSSSSNSTCILPGDLCDGIPDCPGVPGRTADEQNCTACSSGAFLCQKDSRCIRSEWVCDETNDCSDGEEEKCCANDHPRIRLGVEYWLEAQWFTCDGMSVHRWEFVVCDGVRDCQDGLKCRKSQDGKDFPCVPAKKVCDGWVDCLDGEDERNCTATSTTLSSTETTTEATTTTEAPTTTEAATTTTTTRARSSIPAGTPTSTATSPSHCPLGKVPCPGTSPSSSSSSNNTCILPTDLCDGIPDCPGVPGFTADEQNCSACSSRAFLCQKDSRCIRREWLCDRLMDCSDGEDEKCCRSDRRVTWHGRLLNRARDSFACNGLTVFYEQRRRWSVVLCDGVQDCEYGEDESSSYCKEEKYPSKYRFPVCHNGAVKCWKSEGVADSSPCVPAKKVCDGWNDCMFGEDESNCSATSTTTTTSMASSSISARTPTSTATSPSVASPVPPDDAAPATSSSDAVRS